MISVFTTRKNDWYEALLTLTMFLVLVGCSPSEQMERDATSVPDSDSLLVYVVNYPLQYFAQRIGGDRIDVRFPAPADIDPAFWSPDGEDIAGFQRADLIFLNGAGYAAWVSRATLPQSKLVDTSAAFEDQLIPVESAITHTHGPEGAHSHGRIAFTVWLDATLALEQARAVRDALLEADPDGREGYNTRYEALEMELAELDADLQELATVVGNQPLFFSHPVYQYLVLRYEVNGVELHWEPDAMPTEEMWQNLARLRDQHPASWMIWESAPLPEVVSRLEASGIRSIVFDPGGNVPEDGDYLSLMHGNIDRLSATTTTR